MRLKLSSRDGDASNRRNPLRRPETDCQFENKNQSLTPRTQRLIHQIDDSRECEDD